MGFTGVFPSFIGFYWVLLGFTRFFPNKEWNIFEELGHSGVVCFVFLTRTAGGGAGRGGVGRGGGGGRGVAVRRRRQEALGRRDRRRRMHLGLGQLRKALAVLHACAQIGSSVSAIEFP